MVAQINKKTAMRASMCVFSVCLALQVGRTDAEMVISLHQSMVGINSQASAWPMRLRGGGCLSCFGVSGGEAIKTMDLTVHYTQNETETCQFDVAVAGSGNVFGNWDLSKALMMDNRGQGRWTVTLR
jgi:hypothetical protein